MGVAAGRITYDRTTLLLIGGGSSIPEFKPAEPDLVKDETSARSIRAARSKGLIPKAKALNPRTLGIGDNNVASSKAIAAETPEEVLITKSTSKQSRKLLDQLTPDNLEELTPLFTGLPLGGNPKRMSDFIRALFEKAIERPALSSVYARILQAICLATFEAGKTFKMITERIRKLCHAEFIESSVRNKKFRNLKPKLEHMKVKGKDHELQKNSLEQEIMLSRQRGLGFVALVGELYKVGLLTPEFVMGRVNCLKNSFTHEENFECLCAFLTGIGQMLEHDLEKLSEDGDGRPSDSEDLELKATWMDKVFTELVDYQGKGLANPELSSAISRVIQLRRDGWKAKDQDQGSAISAVAANDNEPLSGKGTAAAAPTSSSSSATTSPIPEVDAGAGTGSIVGDLSLSDLSLTHHVPDYEELSDTEYFSDLGSKSEDYEEAAPELSTSKTSYKEKEKIQYDRGTLLLISGSGTVVTMEEFNATERGFPNLEKGYIDPKKAKKSKQPEEVKKTPETTTE